MITQKWLLLLVAFLAVVSLFSCDQAPPNHEAIRIARVVDGDTIDVDIAGKTQRIRLIGLDTPEVYGKVDCFGKEASQFTKSLLPLGRAVRLEKDLSETDRYGRLLRYVYLPDGRMIN